MFNLKLQHVVFDCQPHVAVGFRQPPHGFRLVHLGFDITSATGTLRPALLMVPTAVARSMLQAHIRMRMPRSTSLEFCMCTFTIRFSYT